MRGRRVLATALAVAVAIVVIGVPAPEASAVFKEMPFVSLRDDLEDRRDNELATPGDKTAKKQRKAVDKCLKGLAKPSTKFSTDIKTAGKCANFVAKPFADEFITTGKLADFGETFATLATNLTGGVQALVDDLNAQADALGGKTATKIRKLTAKADANIAKADALGTNYKKRFGKLAAAAKAVEAGQKTADKSVLKGKAKRDQVIMTIDGEKWVSDKGQILTQFYSNDDGLRLFGRRDRADGGTDEIDIRIAPVPSPGRYNLADIECVDIKYTEKPTGGPNVVFNARTDGGVVILDEANLDKPAYRARFFFTVEDNAQNTREVTNGSSFAGAGNILGGNILFLFK